MRSSLPPGTRLQHVLARVRNPLWSAAAVVIVFYGLREARAVLVPIAVAMLLAIIVSPAVAWLEKRKLPRVAAVLLVVLGMMAMLAAVGAMVGGSVAGFRESLPAYVVKLQAMVVQATLWLEQRGVRVDYEKALQAIEPAAAAEKAAGFIRDSLEGVLKALSNTFLVVLTMVLILVEGKTVPAKLRLLSGDEEAEIGYFRSIAGQVQSYLAIKTAVSLGVGVLAGVWAAVLGVDFALLWGLLAFLLNYIPNIGGMLAAVPAMLLALIQHGPGTALALAIGHIIIHMIIGNVLEPMWMGRKLGLSTTVVFMSLAVWYEIWGPVGMLLSVPLTMVIKIMLAHSRDYAFIAQLLDTGEDLMPPSRGAVAAVASASMDSRASAPPAETPSILPSVPSSEPVSGPAADGPAAEGPATVGPATVDKEPTGP